MIKVTNQRQSKDEVEKDVNQVLPLFMITLALRSTRKLLGGPFGWTNQRFCSHFGYSALNFDHCDVIATGKIPL